jgi:anti-sigma factor RsiW
MNGDLKLKLQAWVDGELTGAEAHQVEALVAKDAQAAAVVGELRITRAFLADNELAVPVPATREFYWSQIRRGIEQAERAGSATPATSSFWSALRRFMVPASGLAMVMLLAALSVKYFGSDSLEDAATQMVEVENLSDDMSSISYRSQAENLFVVYVYSKDTTGGTTEETPAPLSDLLFQ